MMDHRKIRSAVGAVLTNASNYPPAVQPYVLGGDLTDLLNKVVAAVLETEAPPEAPVFERGDHVVLNEGMGNYSLGVVVHASQLKGMVYVLLDGYTNADGEVHKPYGIPVNPSYLNKIEPERLEYMRKTDADNMREGFTPIYAEVDDDPFV